jgi:hypothetical protein
MITRSFLLNFIFLLSMTTIPLLMSACGGNLGARAPTAVSKASYQLNYGTGYWDSDEFFAEVQAVGEYECPSKPNVLPAYDWDIDGTNRYRVCASSVSNANVLIYGEPSSAEKANRICVFPLQYVDRTHVFIKPDLTTGRALVKCVPASQSNGATVSFPATNFNMVLIVESKDFELAQACLDPIRGVDFFSCPHYAYGKFRSESLATPQ